MRAKVISLWRKLCSLAKRKSVRRKWRRKYWRKANKRWKRRSLSSHIRVFRASSIIWAPQETWRSKITICRVVQVWTRAREMRK